MRPVLVAFCTFVLALFTSITYAGTYHQVVRDIQTYLYVSDQTEHIRSWYDGVDAVTKKHCSAVVESNPDSVKVTVNQETTTRDASIEIYGSGTNDVGDLIAVTKVAQVPKSFLVSVYFERRGNPRDNGVMTLVLGKSEYNTLWSASISNGEGVSNCSNLRAR